MIGEPPSRGTDEAGMILVNVLLFVAIASGILLLMISSEDSGLERGLRMREAARAMAIAKGGELSAVVALRRDMMVGPDSDNRAEPWAALAEQGAPVQGGTFDLAIADAQDRFNINGLMKDDPVALGMLFKIGNAVGMTTEQATRAVAAVRQFGPVTDLRPLAAIGLNDAQLVRLSGLLTALPYNSKINLNAAGEDMLTILIGDAFAARQMVELRERQGFLSPDDLALLKINMPAETAFTSSLFWVRTRVRIGGTSQQITSLIARKAEPDEPRTVQVVARWTGGSAPAQAPALP